MSRNGLRRHYARLTAEERFRFDVLAMARGDEQESERLVSSCPRFSYTMNDRVFTGRWLGVLDMTLRVYLGIAGHLERIAMMGVMREMLPFQDRYARDRMRDTYLEGHRAGARQARGGREGEGPCPRTAPRGDRRGEGGQAGGARVVHPAGDPRRAGAQGGRARPHRMAGLRGVLRRDAGIVKVVQEAGASRVGELEVLAKRLDLDPDPETVERIRDGLTEAWCSVSGRGGG